MLHHRQRALSALCAVLVGAAVLAGCGDTQPPAGRGRLADYGTLAGQSYTVGGKEFAEQLVLCQITAAALESVGASVTQDCGVSGSDVNRQHLLDGDIDMYWEYNGTAWTNYLHRPEPPSPDSTVLYAAVKQADAANGIVWLDQTPMNDAYAFSINRRDAQRLNVHTLSDMARVIRANPQASGVCIEPEFGRRPDGWGATQASYGFKADPRYVQTLEINSIYQPTSTGNPCLFGEVYKTDGRIGPLGLVILLDDQNRLPKYNASVTIRKDVFDRNPAIANVMAPIAAALNDTTMTTLNARVAVNDEDPRTVARDWMRSQGFIT